MTSHNLFGSAMLWEGLAKYHNMVRVLHRDSSAPSANGGRDEAVVVRRSTSPIATAGGDSSSKSGAPSTPGKGKDQKDGQKELSVLDVLVLEVVQGTLVMVFGLAIWNVSKIIAKLLTNDEGSGDVDQVKSSAVKHLNEILKKRGRSLDKPLNSHETHIAEDVIDPDDIDSGFGDIGGMNHLKQEVWELAILPLLRPDLFKGKSKLTQQPSGILLYGKPGCGKTLLAKAIAKESEAVFIPIKLSKILNKWVGESNKLVAATFSLARKLAPSIIFIDELDTFLSDTVDPSASKSMESLKAEFLTMWDGITTNVNQAPVLVLGATNRPQLIDQAILRRMPRTFEVPLPNAQGREQILRVLLQDQPMDKGAERFISEMASVKYTRGYSGSDLKELCRAAAMEPIREVMAEESRRAVMGESRLKVKSDADIPKEDLRPVSKNDFFTALSKVKRTGQAAKEYGRNMAADGAAEQARDMLGNFDQDQLRQMMQQLLAQWDNQIGSTNGGRKPNDDDEVGDVPPMDFE